jgi:hypothetical protein
MPDTIVEAVYDAQLDRIVKLNKKYYDLLSIFPREWFNEDEKILDLIKALRNETALFQGERKAILVALMYAYSDNFHERDIDKLFERPMKYFDHRFKMTKLISILKSDHSHQFKNWEKRYSVENRELTEFIDEYLEFKEGSFVKLSDVVRLYNSPISKSKLMNIDDRFVIMKKNLCKSCSSIFKKECCENYERSNKTSCVILMNMALKKFT